MELKIWWISNPPRKPYEVKVASLAEGAKILDALANYDLYLGDDTIWANAGGVMEKIDGDWEDVELDDDLL